MARAIARIIALALDLDAGFFDKPEMLGEPIAVLRLLHYEGVRQVPGHALSAFVCVASLDAIYITMVVFYHYQVKFQILKGEYMEPELILTMA